MCALLGQKLPIYPQLCTQTKVWSLNLRSYWRRGMKSWDKYKRADRAGRWARSFYLSHGATRPFHLLTRFFIHSSRSALCSPCAPINPRTPQALGALPRVFWSHLSHQVSHTATVAVCPILSESSLWLTPPYSRVWITPSQNSYMLFIGFKTWKIYLTILLMIPKNMRENCKKHG